jgi:gas vesicle protein
MAPENPAVALARDKTIDRWILDQPTGENKMNDVMNQNTHFNPGSFLLGALLGGVTGAAAMLLTAKQSGEKTRDQIQTKGEDLRDQATTAVEDVVSLTRDTARTITSDLRAKAREIQHGGQDLLAKQKDRVNAALDDAKIAN